MAGRPPGPRKIQPTLDTRRAWRIRKSKSNPLYWVLVELDGHGHETLGHPVISAFEVSELRQSPHIRPGDSVEVEIVDEE